MQINLNPDTCTGSERCCCSEAVPKVQEETLRLFCVSQEKWQHTENLLIAQTSAPWRGPEEHAQIKSHGLPVPANFTKLLRTWCSFRTRSHPHCCHNIVHLSCLQLAYRWHNYHAHKCCRICCSYCYPTPPRQDDAAAIVQAILRLEARSPKPHLWWQTGKRPKRTSSSGSMQEETKQKVKLQKL